MKWTFGYDEQGSEHKTHRAANELEPQKRHVRGGMDAATRRHACMQEGRWLQSRGGEHKLRNLVPHNQKGEKMHKRTRR